MKSRGSDITPQPSDDSHEKGAGYWGAHVGGLISVAFSMASGYLAAPIIAGNTNLKSWVAVPIGAYLVNKLATMSGEMAASEFKNPADSLKMQKFTRSMILFASFAAAYSTFIMTGETEKYKAELHNLQPVRENIQQPRPEPPKAPTEPHTRKWQRQTGPETSVPHTKFHIG